ncbi:hypothetical protein IG631_08017 [Alternaria alternata]|nr:hypothetical protein IG631_08017 [Alternaria alternata]
MSSNASKNSASSRDASPSTNSHATSESQVNYQKHRDNCIHFIDHLLEMLTEDEKEKSRSEPEEWKKEVNGWLKRNRGHETAYNDFVGKFNRIVEEENEYLKMKLLDEFRQIVQNALKDGVVFSHENGGSD